MRIWSHNKPLDFLRKGRDLSGNVLATAAKNQKTLDIVQQSIPPKLFHACLGARIIDDLIIVVTSSQAATGKIHYYSQEILNNCQQTPWLRQIKRISIKTATISQQREEKTREINRISESTANFIKATASTISDQQLKHALVRLAEHASLKIKQPE